MRGFLGITGYYRQFIRGYAAIARPLTALLKEDCAWTWGPPQQAAFDKLQEHLRTEPILALPVADRPFLLHTDFCGDSIAAVLEQLGTNNRYHVIA